MKKCKKGYKGSCCCNCSNQIELVQHPLNTGEGKGSITKVFAYACKTPEIIVSKNKMIFFNNKHGMCKFYNPKKK